MADDKTPDAELIAAYLKGDCEGFNALYNRYKNPLYRYLRKLMAPNVSQVDDIFQETWKRAIEALPKYKDNGMFLAWLMRIGYSRMIDYYRSAGTRVNGDWSDTMEILLTAPESEDPAQSVANAELKAAIGAAIESLPPEQKTVFLLRMQKMKFEDISAKVGSPVNTCLARMRYAIQKMKKFLLGNFPDLFDKKGKKE